MVTCLAHALVDMDLEPGDRLACQVDKFPQALALYGACMQSGIVFLPLNTAYTADEIGYFVKDSGARAFVCDEAKAEALRGIAEENGARLETLNGDGTGSLTHLAEGQPDRFDTVDRDADDLAALLYTSGTTGRSKGAMPTQTNLLSNAEVLVKEWRFTADDVLLNALPIFHTHGLFVATNITLAAGGSMIFLPKFDLDKVIDELPRATAMMRADFLHPAAGRSASDPRPRRAHPALRLRLRAIAGRDPPRIQRAHRPRHPRTLRHDRNQYEHLQPL